MYFTEYKVTPTFGAVHPVWRPPVQESPGALLLLLVPLVYLAAALAPFPARRWRLAGLAAGAAALFAVASVAWLAVTGPSIGRGPAVPLGPFGSFAVSLRLDALTVGMLLLMTGIAALILRFSDRYLDGEGGRESYLRWFLATVAAASLIVIANNLLLLALAWTASSLALHQLLTFYADRPQAIIAAHKKFLLSRIADLCILVSVGLIGWSLGTLEIDQALSRATALPAIPATLAAGGVLLAIGVILRSAQLPFHGWLIQVMEAPTPVSALLHAGIVNIGGFVMIRLGGLMLRLDAAQLLLVLAGTVTAVLAALVMTTRVSVKVSLAWSTAAQMGFMLVECGLGAYGLALLHLVAHSLYKAHAFLRSGSTVEQHVLRGMTPALPTVGLGRWFGAAVAGALVVGAGATALGVRPWDEPGLVPAGVILALALAPLFTRASLADGWRPAALTLGIGTGLTAIYAAWHAAFTGIVPAMHAAGTAMEFLRAGTVILGFSALYLAQAIVSARPTGALARTLYPACYAGFYLDEIFTRLTFRLWPPQPVPVLPTPSRRRSPAPLERAA